MKKIITILVFSTIFFSGCSFLPNENKFSSKNSTQIGEALLPEDVLFLIKLDTTNEAEKENLEELRDIFVSEEIEEEIMFNFEEELSQFELSYENDLKPLIGEKSETILAFGGDFVNQNPDIYIIQKLNNPEKYTEITDKLVLQKEINPITNGFTFKSNEDEVFLGQKSGYLAITNNQENFETIMSLEPKDSLIYNQNYVDVRENLPANFLVLTYLNADLLMDEAKGFIQNNQENVDANVSSALENPVAKIMQSFGMSVNAQEDGIKILGFLQGNNKIMKELDFKFDETANQEMHLAKYLPGKNLYLYLEGFNLKSNFLKFEENLAENSPEALEKFEEQKTQIKALMGIDLEKDILNWLDSSVAFSVQDIGAAIPGITLAFDVSGDPEGAGKLVNTLDSFLSIALLSLKEYAAAVNKEDIKIGESLFEKISILPENLPLELQEQGDLIIEILGDVKIFYGITDNNVMMFTTYPNLAEDFGKDIVAENSDFKQISKKIKQKGQGFTYFSPANFINHLTKVVEINQKYSSMSADDQATIDTIVEFMEPFKAFVFTSIAHKDSFEAQGFLKINK